MIKTKRLYDNPEPRDGLRVLVTRYYPRGIPKERFDVWEKELSPSPSLLAKFKGGDITWVDFVYRFRDEMENPVCQKLIGKYKNMKKDVTLLCYESEGEPCHRHLLKLMMGKGFSVR